MRAVFSRGPLILMAVGVAALLIAAAVHFKKGGEQTADIDRQEGGSSQPTRPPVMDGENVVDETSQRQTAPPSEAAGTRRQEGKRPRRGRPDRDGAARDCRGDKRMAGGVQG